jgi:predicted nucleotidyltransferase
MDVDLHGHDPNDIVDGDVFDQIVQQAWEMGETKLNIGSSGSRVDESNGKYGLKPHGYWVFGVS